jgi:hypothetical protein
MVTATGPWGSGCPLAGLCRCGDDRSIDKATSKAPSTVNEGFLSRYDSDSMTSEDGTELPDAAEL